MLPQQYIKLSKFAEIGVNGKWYIDKGNGTFDGTCTCIYMYVNVHGYLIGVYTAHVRYVYDTCLCVSTIDQHSV